jgi:hypothetical protein
MGASTSTTGASSANGVMTTGATQQASVEVATGLDKGKKPPSAAVTTLLLQPLLLQLAKAP